MCGFCIEVEPARGGFVINMATLSIVISCLPAASPPYVYSGPLQYHHYAVNIMGICAPATGASFPAMAKVAKTCLSLPSLSSMPSTIQSVASIQIFEYIYEYYSQIIFIFIFEDKYFLGIRFIYVGNFDFV